MLLSVKSRVSKFYSLSFGAAAAAICTATIVAIAPASPVQAATFLFTANLSGAAESPPNGSPGTGTAQVTIDDVLHTMLVQANFSGLTGTTTAAHIHGATAVAGTGTAGVITTTPSFPGFPLGVPSGSYINSFDLTLASSYNAAFVTANGGTTAGAETALTSSLLAGKAYFNIHTSTFGGGEIRGFLVQQTTSVPEPFTTIGTIIGGMAAVRMRRKLSGAVKAESDREI